MTSKPAHVTIISGPGIVSGGPPERLHTTDTKSAQKSERTAPRDIDSATQLDDIDGLQRENERLRRQLEFKSKTQSMPCRKIDVTTYGFVDDGYRIRIFVDVDKTLLSSQITTSSRTTCEAGTWAHFAANSAEFHTTMLCR